MQFSDQSDDLENSADLVLLNGSVWTVNDVQPWAEAVAVKEGKILEVGTTTEIKNIVKGKERVVDLKGAFVIPGFIDSHTHFLDGGFVLSGIQLRDVKTREEFVSKIAEKAEEIEEGEWICNGDWNHQLFKMPELPRKEWIDNVTRKNPVCINRLDHHMVLVNSVALRIAGISKNTPSPSGGEIVKDTLSGEPTGILKDSAMDIVRSHIPEPPLKEKMKSARLALKHANESGVTSIHEMATAANFEVYQELFKQDNLTARLYVFIPISEVDLYAHWKLKASFGNNFLKIGGLKGFVDGSLGSSTALFFKPYEDNPKNTGLLSSDMLPEGTIKKRLMKADEAGLQVAVHAIGDRANHIIIGLFEDIVDKNVVRDRRWRIEHAQHLLDEDIERMGKLNVIASVQPYHAIDDGCWVEKKLGTKRASKSYAYKSLFDKGVITVFGSDWTVAPLNPLTGIYAAVTRRTLDGKYPEGWIPEQKTSIMEAIKAYTLNGAYAEFSENVKGSIEKGKFADLVVLDRNLFEIPAEDMLRTQVLMTVFNGKIVYESRFIG